MQDPRGWVAWIRLVAVPFVLLEVAVERGNFPPGDERWAWAITAVFAVGALVLFRFHRLRLPALVFDVAILSAYVILYSFESGTPVRQVLFLATIEGALRFGRRGGGLVPFFLIPALFFFEWRQAVRLDLHPFDAGHVVFPFFLQVGVGVIVGALAERARDVSKRPRGGNDP